MPPNESMSLTASAMQTAMLSTNRSNMLPQPYVQQLSWTFKEALDVGAFKKAWIAVLNRHAVFRHTFSPSETGRWQIGRETRLQVHFRFRDLRNLPTKERSQFLRTFKREDFRKGFLGVRYLCRFHLFQLGDAKFQLVWTSHHCLFDGRGRLNLIREFQECYRAFLGGIRPHLKPPVSFENHLGWLEKNSFNQAKQYWRTYLQGVTECTPLAFGRSDLNRSKGVKNRQTKQRCSKRLTTALQRWSKNSGYSLNLLFQAAWAIYLWRTSGKQQVIFGGTRACRRSSIPDAEQSVGLFVNTVPVCVRFDQLKTVPRLFSALRSDWVDMRAHEHTPADTIKEVSELPLRDPLFESLIGFEKYQLEDLIRSETGGRYQFNLEGRTEIPLVIQAYDGDRIELFASYDSGRFSKASISRLMTCVQNLVSQLIDKPGARLVDLSLLNKRQATKILKVSRGKHWDRTPGTIQDRFAEMVRRYPGSVAIRQGDQALTYQELETRSNQWARFLKAKGVKPGSSVGLFFDREPNLLLSILAILKAGAAYVPFDVEYPKDRLRWMLGDVKPELILSSSSLAKDLKQLGLKALIFEELEGAVYKYSSKPPSVKVKQGTPAYIMYTSGSTGNPKGVVVPHRGIMRLVIDTDYVRLSQQTITLQMAPVSFDAATFEIWAPLLNGGTCVLYPGRMPDLEVIRRQIEDHGINTLWLTASLFNFIIDSSPSTLRGVRQLLAGGEALSPVHIRKASRALPNTQLINGYGPTENTTFSCCYRIPKSQSAKHPVPLGRAIAGSSAYVLDGSHKLLPFGVPGELYVGGNGVALGYFRRKRLTTACFVPDPFTDLSDRLMYATGDKVILNDDGQFEFLGRNDDQIKIRGHRIEPGEVQVQLSKHPRVREVFVKPLQVNQETRLVAFLVYRTKRPDNVSETRNWLKERVPEYMVPGQLVEIDALPLTPNGKVDASALTVEVWKPIDRVPLARGKLSATQKVLRQFWIKILGSSPDSIQDRFLDSGGHSMSAIHFIYNIRNRFDVDMPFCVFEENDSLEKLANWVDAKRKKKAPNRIQHFKMKAVKVPRVNPLGHRWSQIYKPSILSPGPGKIISRAFQINGLLQVANLQRAINHVVSLHDRLRTRAKQMDGELYEETLPVLEVPIRQQDLSHLSARSARAEVDRVFDALALGGMDMNQLPLLDLWLIRFARYKHVLIFTIHHSVVDAVSLELIFSQLGQTYSELSQGNEPTIAPARFNYRQFYKAYEEWFQTSSRRQMDAFWKRETADLRYYKLPFERKRAKRAELGHAIMRNYRFKKRWSEQIQTFCSSQGVSKFVFVLSAVHTMLYRYLNENMVFTSLPSDSRKASDELDIVADLGCNLFVKSYVDDELSFLDVCQRLNAKLVELVEHNTINSPRNSQWAPEDPEAEFKFSNLFCVMGSPETGSSLKLAGLEVAGIDRKVRSVVSKYNLVFRENERDLELALHYPKKLVVKNGMERMFYNLQWFIRLGLENPDLKLGEFPDLKIPKCVRTPLGKQEKKKWIFDTQFQP